MLISASNLLYPAKQSRSLWPREVLTCTFLRRTLYPAFDAAAAGLCQRAELSKVVVVGLAGTYWARHVRAGSALAKLNFKEAPEGTTLPLYNLARFQTANTNWFKFAGPVRRCTLV